MDFCTAASYAPAIDKTAAFISQEPDRMPKLTHLNARGEAVMVDVSDKAVTQRTGRRDY